MALEYPAQHAGKTVLAGIVAADDHDELVAAVARQRIGFAQAGLEPPGHHAQQAVAGIVTKAFVDELEAVQIHEGDRNDAALALGLDDGLFEPVVEQITVGQPRQDVMIGLVRKLVLVALDVADVVLHTDEMGHLAVFVTHGC